MRQRPAVLGALQQNDWVARKHARISGSLDGLGRNFDKLLSE